MLRVGIILESFISCAWEARLIEHIRSSESLRVELVLHRTVTRADQSSWANLSHNLWGSALFHLYERWDYRRNRSERDSLAGSDLSSLLTGIPVVHLAAEVELEPIPQEQMVEIRRYGLDVVIQLGSTLLPEGHGLAQFGVWSISSSVARECRTDPFLFWDLYARQPVSEIHVRVHGLTQAQERIAFRSYAAMDQASLYRSRNPVYWKVGEAVLRGLRELQARRDAYIQVLPQDSRIQCGHHKGMPNSLQMIRFMGMEMSRWLQARARRLRSNKSSKWTIGIRRRTTERQFDEPSGYSLVPSPKDRFYADPFLIERDGRTHLFFEDFRYAEGRACISHCEVSADGRPGMAREVLSRPYHLSYPFLFEDDGNIYMIPETRGHRTIELYRATAFPLEWTFDGILIDEIYAVDATIQRLNGKLWMFTGLSNGDYSNSDDLAVFSAPTLKGPWKPHPQNPVVSDVRRARPAGMLFYEGGRLIRPSQDCGKAYGYALIFSEVLTLTDNEYREQPISRLDPELVPYAEGNHTYNRTKQFEVIDRTYPARIANRPRDSREHH